MKTIGSLKVEEQTISNLKRAVEKYNSKNLFPVSEAEFRRMALEMLSQMILLDMEIPVKVTK